MFLRFLYRRQKYATRQFEINGRGYSAIIADSFVKRMIGLMFRDSLKDNQCMLFIFASPGMHRLWMRNMLFAIDVIWLDRECNVVDIANSLMPCKSIASCPEYGPKSEAKYIIELNAGELAKTGIKTGSRISLPLG